MAALNPNNKNASLRHKRDRSSLARLNMAFVLENLGDLCAISMRNTATCDQLIERLKNNCAYWKANDRDAKILVDQVCP
uniref:Uncharacterized protein n=1 Tax=Romanomermis culicivorax TaxID=13658 RepID=A0A915HPH5_ROMCU